MDSSRREFLLLLAGAIGVTLVGAGCGGDTNGDDRPPARLNADGTVTVPGAAALGSGEGLSYMVTRPDGHMMAGVVFHSSEGKWGALDGVCPHAGCPIAWKSSAGNDGLYCPCHGSRFDSSGKVLNGPATASLKTYAVQKQGNDIVIKMHQA